MAFRDTVVSISLLSAMKCVCAIYARYEIANIHEKVVYISLLILRIASLEKISQECENGNDFKTNTHH